MKISSLYIYPIKSLQGISLSEAEVLEKGFSHDRRWMIVNHENALITQRTHTQLSQVKITLTDTSILASYSGMPDQELPLILPEGESIDVTVWNDQVRALKAQDSINDWFSEIVEEPCKLAFMPEDASRPVNPKRAVQGEHVSFADGYPYLIIGQSSLDDLNSRMDVNLPMNRFRPNIVVEGSTAYEEDDWNNIQIGNVKFYVSHPCKRCVFTTIDQETGKKAAEPLKTLATYRREGSDVIFGVNTLALSTGTISVGDNLVLL